MKNVEGQHLGPLTPYSTTNRAPRGGTLGPLTQHSDWLALLPKAFSSLGLSGDDTCVDGLPGGERLRGEDRLEILGVDAALHELLEAGKRGVAPVGEPTQVVPSESVESS